MEKLKFEFYPQHLTNGETKRLNSWTMKAGLKCGLVKLTVDAYSMTRRGMLRLAQNLAKATSKNEGFRCLSTSNSNPLIDLNPVSTAWRNGICMDTYEAACANAQAVDDGLKRLYFSPRVGVQRRPAENVGW